ncbi:MAG: hypothetical protein ACO1RX_20500 [Candidatus Sericytochromatia bacterium]
MKHSAYWVGALLLISACHEQTQPLFSQHLPAETAPLTSLAFPVQPKPEAQGQATLTGTQLRVRLQLPPRPLFGIQALYLGDADTLAATVSDSHGKTYTPVGADGNGHVPYPSNGVIELSFNDVLPDPLLFVEVKVQDNLADIPQAELATVLKQTQTTPATTTLNFQTTAMAKTMRTLLNNNPDRARSLSLTALTSLINSITGASPTYAQRHPSLVNTTLLAQDLEAQNPGSLTPASYRLDGHLLNVSVAGLFHTDKIIAQVTDAASAMVTQGNGVHSLGQGTPGNGLQVRVQEVAGNINRYVLNSPPGPINLTEGGSTTLTVEALGQVGELRVNTETFSTQNNPKLAMDAEGNFVICWGSNFQDGSGFGIYAQRYNHQGVPLGNEFRVNSTTTGGQTSNSIAMDSDGDFVVSWHSAHTGDTDIYAQLYNSLGEPQGSEFRANTYTSDSQRVPFVAMDASGNFTIMWSSSGQEANLNIYGQRYNHLGVAQGTEFRLNDPVGAINNAMNHSLQDAPIAMNASGAHVVAWKQGTTSSDIYARTYSATGVAGPPFRVNTYTPGNQTSPVVAMDDAGNFIVGWDSTDGDDLGIYAQRYAADGTPQGSEFQVNITTAGAQISPKVAMHGPSGDFVFTWISPQPDTTPQVIARRYASDGTPQTGEYQVNLSEGNKYSPSLAIAPDSSGVFVWIDIDASTQGISALRFGTDGLPILAP